MLQRCMRSIFDANVTVTGRWRYLFAAIATLCSACGRDKGSAEARKHDAAALDASEGAKSDSDASSLLQDASSLVQPRFLDASPSDFHAIPEDAETNLGPDARPSSYPEARTWLEPVPPKDCCSAITGVATLTPVSDIAGPVAMAWTGRLWGVAWSTLEPVPALRFRTVRPDGFVVGPLEEPVPVDTVRSFWPSIAWDDGRFAVSYSSIVQKGTRDVAVHVAILNEQGYAPWGGIRTLLPANSLDVQIARYAAKSVWLVAARDPAQGTREQPLMLSAVDDTGAPVGDEPVQIGTTVGAVGLAGLKSRAIAVWAGPDGVRARSFSWPDATASTETLVMPHEGLTEDTPIATVALRDTVVVAVAMNQRLVTLSLDPWMDNVLSGPNEVASVAPVDNVWAVGLGAAERLGYVGACYVRREEGDQSLFFRILGPDGRPWSPEHVVTSGHDLIWACAVAFNGKSWAVAWWVAGGQSSADDRVDMKLLGATDG